MINIAKKVNRLQNSSMIISTIETQHTGPPQRSPGKLAQETRVHWVNLLVGIGMACWVNYQGPTRLTQANLSSYVVVWARLRGKDECYSVTFMIKLTLSSFQPASASHCLSGSLMV